MIKAYMKILELLQQEDRAFRNRYKSGEDAKQSPQFARGYINCAATMIKIVEDEIEKEISLHTTTHEVRGVN